ncbi:MAG: response regulator [Thermogemmatispora sp.]|uniref:response regulator n=1 Tax=Thermogemmatispora sp. TaxID=1968838 RepID=UPI0019F6C0E9|nr:response regulator [Thermogemmatispora sp.]MBE3564784.1 response regulator [Thermogemmatispora sp.]
MARAMVRPRPLRVLIVGQQESLNTILERHLRQRGYEVRVLLRGGEIDLGSWVGDVLLYDMDGDREGAREGEGEKLLQPPRSWPEARFTVIMGSSSVSRDRLEELGVVAFLLKPFDVGRLLRYLGTLHRLVQTSEERGDYFISDRQGAEGNRARVLIVDDDVDVAQTIQQSLKAVADYELAVAHDGLEALERCVEWRPHCVVADLIMPWMNGYQMMRCLKRSALPSPPAFVLMSALTPRQLERRPYLREEKSVVYVEKPFFVEHLQAAIEQALQKLAPATRPLA